MTQKQNELLIPDELEMNKILFIRDKKVMIDRDLAELYGVTTFRLNEQVKRNKKRFPEDFMFRLTKKEKEQLIEQYEHLNSLKFSPALPNAFTEHGAVMLVSILNSDRAIAVNIQIVRIFTKMQAMFMNYKEVLLKIEKLERQSLQNTTDIEIVFQYIKQLIVPPEQANRKRIGFRRQDEEN
jgi:hypothetical protein